MSQTQTHRPRAAGTEGPLAPQGACFQQRCTPTIWTGQPLPRSTPLCCTSPHAGHAVTPLPCHRVLHPPEDQPQSTTTLTRCPEAKLTTSSMGPAGLNTSINSLGVVSSSWAMQSPQQAFLHSYQVFLRIRRVFEMEFQSSLKEIAQRFTIIINPYSSIYQYKLTILK